MSTSPATGSARLQRLLALVPYVVSRKAVGLAETAAAFGVSERELVDDLNLLWCVELRAPDPYCPIDLSYEGGEIVVSQAERWTARSGWPWTRRARCWSRCGCWPRSGPVGTLGAAAGPSPSWRPRRARQARPSAQVAVQVDKVAQQAVLTQLQDALAGGRLVHLSLLRPGPGRGHRA